MSGRLPDRLSLRQLRRQAKELKQAAQAGEPWAVERIQAYVPGPPTLAAAQLTLAREHGLASWPKLKEHIETAAMTLAEQVEAFLHASLGGSTIRRAERLLAGEPRIAGHDLRTAIVLGDVERVRQTVEADPEAARRPDAVSGWTPLLGVCMSWWHAVDPERAAGLLETARLLLDTGADPNVTVGGRPGDRGYCSPLFAAAGCAHNPAITALLLERGARVDPHTVYLAAFEPSRGCLRLLLDHAQGVDVSEALAASISIGDAEGVRLLLAAGADPNAGFGGDLLGEDHADHAPDPVLALHAAIEHHGSAELVGALLAAGATPDTPGIDGRSPHQLAVRHGRADLARLLVGYGARPDATEADLFLSACLNAGRGAAERYVAGGRVRVGWLTDAETAALVEAADQGNVEAVRLMLDLGFPMDARGEVNGATALHTAAGAGSADVVRLLLERGAEVDARDPFWNGTPITWATVGSGAGLGRAPAPDHVTTVRLLVEAGASPEAWIEDKPPSPEVAQLLAEYGVTPPEAAE
ncbi:ankyrin repeat domain-containing protein [Flindersiella endophytica]